MASLYDITEFIAGEIWSTECIQIQDYKCLFLSKPCKNHEIFINIIVKMRQYEILNTKDPQHAVP